MKRLISLGLVLTLVAGLTPVAWAGSCGCNDGNTRIHWTTAWNEIKEVVNAAYQDRSFRDHLAFVRERGWKANLSNAVVAYRPEIKSLLIPLSGDGLAKAYLAVFQAGDKSSVVLYNYGDGRLQWTSYHDDNVTINELPVTAQDVTCEEVVKLVCTLACVPVGAYGTVICSYVCREIMETICSDVPPGGGGYDPPEAQSTGPALSSVD